MVVVVDGVGVENYVVEFEGDVVEGFFSENVFFGDVLECVGYGVFDFGEVLDVFVYVEDEVWVGCVWFEVLDFFGYVFVLVEVVDESFGFEFGIVVCGNVVIVDCFC